MTKQTLAQILTYAGTLPFLATGIVPWFAPNIFGLDFTMTALAYSAIIASFIAGIHWGFYMHKDAPMNLFIHSNIVALSAWLGLIITPLFGFFLLALCFLYLLFIDIKLFKSNIIEPWFIRLRLHATGIVILALGLNVLILLK